MKGTLEIKSYDDMINLVGLLTRNGYGVTTDIIKHEYPHSGIKCYTITIDTTKKELVTL